MQRNVRQRQHVHRQHETCKINALCEHRFSRKLYFDLQKNRNKKKYSGQTKEEQQRESRCSAGPLTSASLSFPVFLWLLSPLVCDMSVLCYFSSSPLFSFYPPTYPFPVLLALLILSSYLLDKSTLLFKTYLNILQAKFTLGQEQQTHGDCLHSSATPKVSCFTLGILLPFVPFIL